ncbi:MAG: FixH family protein [Gammaproteobacteria bacterium]|nr:FixH family protein [Gammaproteobacteria bacterium]
MTKDNKDGSSFISQSNKQAMRNPWVLGWLGLLAIVLVVNIGMISTALITSPGLVEQDYYEKGRDHEENFLKKQAARNALGWNFKLDVPAKILLGQSAILRFSVVDKVGVPLDDIKVDVKAYRPSDVTADFNVVMDSFAPGQYQTKVNFMLKGIWELKVKVTQGSETYELYEQRISVTTL